MPSHIIRSRPPRGTAEIVRAERDPDRLRSYLEDAAHVPGGHASAIVFPRSEADVAAVLAGPQPVLAIGAQSSLTGGATPMGELLLSTAKMTAMEVGSTHAVVQPGVTLAALDTALLQNDAWYPPVPTFTGATVGGVVATNAAGAATFKYGATRPWVDALTVVLAGGEVLDVRRGAVRAHDEGYFQINRKAGSVRVPVPAYRMPPVAKVAAGFYAAPGMDLIDLFIGSEGTLGVITSVTLRTQSPRPDAALALVTCPTRLAGLELCAELRSSPGIGIAAIEHMDRRCLELLRSDGFDSACDVMVPRDSELALIVTLELAAGTDSRQAFDEIGRALEERSLETPLARFCRLLARHDVLERAEIALPDNRARQSQFMAMREAVPAAVNSRIAFAQHTADPRIAKMAADVIVPYERLRELLELCESEFSRFELDGAVWGHISDGNLHPNVMARSFAEFERAREVMLTLGRAAIAWGGSPCAEHGVGRNLVKQQLLRELYGAEGVDAMRQVKAALDPDRRLAPGVLGL